MIMVIDHIINTEKQSHSRKSIKGSNEDNPIYKTRFINQTIDKVKNNSDYETKIIEPVPL